MPGGGCRSLERMTMRSEGEAVRYFLIAVGLPVAAGLTLLIVDWLWTRAKERRAGSVGRCRQV